MPNHDPFNDEECGEAEDAAAEALNHQPFGADAGKPPRGSPASPGDPFGVEPGEEDTGNKGMLSWLGSFFTSAPKKAAPVEEPRETRSHGPRGSAHGPRGHSQGNRHNSDRHGPATWEEGGRRRERKPTRLETQSPSTASRSHRRDPHQFSGWESSRSGVTVRTGEDPEYPPHVLNISCAELPSIAGRYTMAAGVLKSGAPVWSRGPWRFFSSRSGHWMVAARRRFDSDVGVLVSRMPHRGTNPQHTPEWEWFFDGFWQPCVRTKITVGTDEVPGYTPRGLGSDGVCFVIDAFLRLHDPARADDPAVTPELARRVQQGTGLDQLMEGLCDEYGAPTIDWRGPAYAGAVWYRIDAFYSNFAPEHRGKVPGLVTGVCQGQYTVDRVMRKLCTSFDTRPEEWMGQYPAALMEQPPRIGTPPTIPTTVHPRNPGGPKLQGRKNEVIFEKAADEPLGVRWEGLVLTEIFSGGAGERNGLASQKGRRLTHIDGHPVESHADIKARVQGAAYFAIRFADAASSSFQGRPPLTSPSSLPNRDPLLSPSPAAPWALTVKIQGPVKRCGGAYSRLSRKVNETDAWARQSSRGLMWLYSTPAGHWCITDSEEDFQTGAGYIYTSAPHRGLLPHRYSGGWDSQAAPGLNGVMITVDECEEAQQAAEELGQITQADFVGSSVGSSTA
eukprot:Hpha_TRINITY_DN29701_c0_g1::TRINITY_DN29701_c0_g1_i1::g.2675::m.2675